MRCSTPASPTGHSSTNSPHPEIRSAGLTGNVISLYAKGMTTGDIQTHLFEIYGTDISRETISKITDTIVDDMHAWQNVEWPLTGSGPGLFP